MLVRQYVFGLFGDIQKYINDVLLGVALRQGSATISVVDPPNGLNCFGI